MLLLEVAKALQYMHNQNFVHGSAYLDNVRVGRDGVAKLINFENTRDLMTTTAPPGAGSVRYALKAIDKGIGHVF